MTASATGASAVISALSLSRNGALALTQLRPEQWREVLSFGDRTQLILPLNGRYRHLLPSA
jgi:hypothetical protein